MPEGDAVYRATARLHAALAGHVVTDWDLRWPKVSTSDARGATTIEVVPRGKHLLHRLDNGITLHTHLRMDGSWRVADPARVTRAMLASRDVRALVGCATATAFGRSLGLVDLVATADEDSIVGHLGPDLLGDGWDPERAVANLATQPDRELGAALLDQRNLAGLGTIWASESAHAAGVWPWREVGQLNSEELAGVVGQAHRLLSGAIARDLRDVPEPKVYRRGPRGCGDCGTPVVAAPVGLAPQQRTLHACPRCQRP